MSAPEHDPCEAELAALGAYAKARQRGAAERLAARIPVEPAIRSRLVTLLDDPDAQRRWGAAYALGVSAEPGPEPVAVLVDMLGHRDGDLRWAATRILAAMARREPSVVPALVGALASPSPLRRKMALYGLRESEAARGEVVRPCLADADPAVRLAALSAMAACGPAEEVAAALLPLLDDADPGVRRAAAATLGRVGAIPQAAVDALERLARQTTDDALARAARGALSRRGAGGPPRP